MNNVCKTMNGKILSRKAVAIFGLFLLYQPLFAEEIMLDDDDKRFSYAIGMTIGEQLGAQFTNQPGIDLSVLLAGMNAVINAEQTLISTDEATQVIQQRQQQQAAEAAEQAKEMQQAGQQFLTENAARDGVTTTPSGLQYEIMESGDPQGTSPSESDSVAVHYQGTLVDGSVFDSSYARGEPAVFPVQGVIAGWVEALQLMKPGDKWTIVLPPQLAYGETGAPPSIGPHSVLKFEIELLEIK